MSNQTTSNTLGKLVFSFLIISLLFGALLGLPLLIGVWLPDAIFNTQRTLAHQRLASGNSFRVIQCWNYVDFYNTELLHMSPDGKVETHVLDGDDNKSWSVPLLVDQTNKTAAVTLSGGRVKKIVWQ